MVKEVTELCVIHTKHCFSCSLVERPGQRKSLRKMLQLHQTVNSLDKETLEKEDRSGPQRAFSDSALSGLIYMGLLLNIYLTYHQTYLSPGPESHDVSRLQYQRIIKYHLRDTRISYSSS